jgi:PAS domain S-box-containing protein
MSQGTIPPSPAELLVQSVTDYAIYMLDPSGTVMSWNAGAQRFKGYVADEIIGENFARFYTEEDRDDALPARALHVALTEGRFEAEGWRVRKDGTRFWASVVIDPIRDERGEHVGFAKVTRDLTERKQLQDALEQSREQFFQAQKMEAIGQLTGGVAHDFNNMLAAIMGSIGLAQRRLARGEDITPFLDNALQAAERGKTLTQRMLAFARKQELELEPVDIIASVRDMAELLARTIGPNIAITTRFPLSLPAVMADRTQLELALMNLVVNARDAMPGGGKIVIGAEEVADEGGKFVRLAVEDDGVGMDAETLQRAVEPFFTTKGIGKGTGLGLSMVQGMVQQCGGRFLLSSGPARGTVAELWLPTTDAAVARPSDARASAPSTERPLRILAVDDDPIVLLNTATTLADIGHEVLQAHSARAALALLEQYDVDLLLTDYAMPGMTGGELVSKAREVRPGLKAVIVSGYADLPEGVSLDVPRLAKPFSDTELASIVATVV